MDLVIGAGITGLSYAAYTKNDCLVLEQEKEAGGYCRSIRQDGFVWDYSGHFFHFRNEDIRRDVMEGIPPQEVLDVVKHSRIRYKDRLVDYPFQKNIHQLPQAEFIDCLYDLFHNPFREGRSFKEMLYARFGRSIAEKFLIPYNEKLYACDLNALDAGAMGRFFPYADKEEIIANFRPSAENSYNARFLYPRGGAAEYVRSVSRRINPGRIALGERVLGIDPTQKTVRTDRREIPYGRLISTMPFPRLLALAGIPYDPAFYTCNKVLVFNIGFDGKGPERTNHWIYFPEKQYCFYRVGFYDNIYGAPRMSLYVELGYRQDEEIDVEAAWERTLADLKAAGVVTTQKVVSRCALVMDPAYVHVNRAMEKDRAEKMAALEAKDIFSIGRYGSWIYCSIEDNILQARDLARKLSAQ